MSLWGNKVRGTNGREAEDKTQSTNQKSLK